MGFECALLAEPTLATFALRSAMDIHCGEGFTGGSDETGDGDRIELVETKAGWLINEACE